MTVNSNVLDIDLQNDALRQELNPVPISRENLPSTLDCSITLELNIISRHPGQTHHARLPNNADQTCPSSSPITTISWHLHCLTLHPYILPQYVTHSFHMLVTRHGHHRGRAVTSKSTLACMPPPSDSHDHLSP